MLVLGESLAKVSKSVLVLIRILFERVWSFVDEWKTRVIFFFRESIFYPHLVK